MKRLFVSLACMMMTSIAVFAQETNEDVILTTDGTVLRGTITDKITPGGTITIIPAAGKPRAAYWSELVAVRRLPQGIPDSVIMGSFDHHEKRDNLGRNVRVYEAPPKAQKFDFRGYEKEEDVLFLVDGAILRGVLLNQRNDGVFSTWTTGVWKEVGGPAVVTNTRVNRGIPDSTLVKTYLNVPEEWREGERRIFSIHAGLSIPMGDLATPMQDGRGSAKPGPAVSLQAGIRLWPGIRWIIGGTYSTLPRGVPQFYLDASTSGDATPLIVTRFMTGVEARTFSSSDFRVRFSALVGLVSMKAGGYEAKFPQTFHHLAGTAKIEEISSSSFGLALGTGVLAGRFSLDIAWIYFKPEYMATTNLDFGYGIAQQISNSSAETDGFLTFSLGYSIF